MKIHLAALTTPLAALFFALSPPTAQAFGNGGGGHSGGGHSGGHTGGHSAWAPHGGGWGGWHHHDGHHFYGGFGFGIWGPYWDPWPWGWGDPYYDGYVPAYPAYPVYETPNALPPPPSYWYYCPSTKTYYPYVAHCPEAWVRVTPPSQP